MTQFVVRYPKWRIALSATGLALCAALCVAGAWAYFRWEEGLLLIALASAAIGASELVGDLKQAIRMKLIVDEHGVSDGKATAAFEEIYRMEMDAGCNVRLVTAAGDFMASNICENAARLREVLLEKRPELVMPTIAWRLGVTRTLWTLVVLGSGVFFSVIEGSVPWFIGMLLVFVVALIPAIVVAVLSEGCVRFSDWSIDWERILPQNEMCYRYVRRVRCARRRGRRCLKISTRKRCWEIPLAGRVFIDAKWQRHFGRAMEPAVLDEIAGRAEKCGRKVERRSSGLKLSKEKRKDEDSGDWTAPEHSQVQVGRGAGGTAGAGAGGGETCAVGEK